MEWKIGEIRQVKGGWCQCVEGLCCKDCAYYNKEYGLCDPESQECLSHKRSDGKEVIFKKLEKVGEPYISSRNKRKHQLYRCFHVPIITTDSRIEIGDMNFIGIEIKQNKDMEEKKLNLKPFDIQKAREGKPVCTRDGRKVRIICFDRVDAKPILALIASTDGKGEDVFDYFVSGKRIANALESDLDLMMLPEKKEGWVNVYKKSIYKTKEDAFNRRDKENYLMTIKVGWEE